jgi:hypothetical protein
MKQPLCRICSIQCLKMKNLFHPVCCDTSLFQKHSRILRDKSSCCQVLSDEKKRALYDQYGEAGVKSAVGGGAGAYTAVIYTHTHTIPLLHFVCYVFL